MTSYEQRQEAKRERLLAMASKRREQATTLEAAGRSALEVIPFGQPILVGHYSERSDRAYRSRAVGKIDRSYRLSEEANTLEQRAEAVGTSGIASDDPDAVSKLTVELEKAIELQERYKAINKAHAEYMKKPASIYSNPHLTHAEKELIVTYVPQYSWLRHPIAPFQIKNNGANIRRIEKRIKQLEQMAATNGATPVEGKGWNMREDIEEGRIIVIFNERQGEEVVNALRHRAFLWSPSRKAWVRKITPNARFAAQQIVTKLNEILV